MNELDLLHKCLASLLPHRVVAGYGAGVALLGLGGNVVDYCAFSAVINVELSGAGQCTAPRGGDLERQVVQVALDAVFTRLNDG